MLVTVIVPTYNRLDMLRIAIASLLAQKHDLPLDILVIDDGSNDGTADWLEHMRACEPILRVVRQENAGVSAARNTGLENLLSETGFVTFLDSDDISPRGALKAQLAPLMHDSDIDLTFGKILVVSAIDPEHLEPAAEAQRLELICVQMSCALYRRTMIERIGRFDPEFRQAEDTDYLLRTFESGAGVLQTDTICLYYYRHDGNMTKDLEESRRYFALALFKSMQRRRADPSLRLVTPKFDLQHIGKVDFY